MINYWVRDFGHILILILATFIIHYSILPHDNVVVGFRVSLAARTVRVPALDIVLRDRTHPDRVLHPSLLVSGSDCEATEDQRPEDTNKRCSATPTPPHPGSPLAGGRPQSANENTSLARPRRARTRARDWAEEVRQPRPLRGDLDSQL